MISPPRVTVVIPHFNGRPFLRDAIRSVETQTLQDWEIVIVDDGSAEEHQLFLNSFESPRIRILRQNHGGAAAATQRAIEGARGVYVAFLDQDDMWRPSKLERAVSILDADAEIDIAFSGYQNIDAAGATIGPVHSPNRARFSFQDLFIDYQIGPTAAVVTRLSAAVCAGPLDSTLSRYYDFDFFLRIARLRPRNVAATRAPLTLYRRHGGQLSTRIETMREEWDRVRSAFAGLHAIGPTEIARARSNMSRYFAFLEYENERFGAACKVLAEAFRYAPLPFLLDRRSWLASAGCFGGLVFPRPVRLAAERLFTGTYRDDFNG